MTCSGYLSNVFMHPLHWFIISVLRMKMMMCIVSSVILFSELQGNLGRSDGKPVLQNMQRALRQLQTYTINSILRARVPIVKFNHTLTGVCGDISYGYKLQDFLLFQLHVSMFLLAVKVAPPSCDFASLWVQTRNQST